MGIRPFPKYEGYAFRSSYTERLFCGLYGLALLKDITIRTIECGLS